MDILMTSLLVAAVIAFAMAAMALGVMLGRKPLRCGCRQLTDADAGALQCESCPHRNPAGGR